MTETSSSQVADDSDGESVEPLRIYVASLADYNHGRLHGEWLDADQDEDTLQAEVNDMLAASHVPGAEEFAIHDYEGFSPARLDEFETLQNVARLAANIRRHGPAFAALAAEVGVARAVDEPELFDESYRGAWESFEHYVMEFVVDMGWQAAVDELPAGMATYVRFDYRLLARDLEMDHVFVRHAGGVWVFDSASW